MTKDTGNWLSAEQAVLPDGTERENLSLINKKLPELSPQWQRTAPDNAEQTDQTGSKPGQ